MATAWQRREMLQSAALGAVALALPAAHAAEPTGGKIKIGQIGVGHAHANKLGVYRNSSDYEVLGIAEPDARLREQAQDLPAYRDLPWMTEEQLLNVPGLRVVTVETRVRDLLATAQRCIDAGKHVHLDKPAGDSLPRYRALLAAAEKQELLVQMGYMFRYSPAVVLLRKFLKEGWLGDLFEVHTVMSKVVPPADRKKLAEFRGGIMFELGCHVIDLVVGVLGKPERVHPFPRTSGTHDDGLADNMLAVLEYKSATATVKSAAIEVDGGSRRHFVACGSAGTFHIQPLDEPNVRLTLDRDRGEYKKGTQEVRFGNYERYVGDAADMARILRGEKECDYSYAHDLAVQETVLVASGMPAA
ncbi:MAG: Gfo/Idh/MocA family oxidoreductase [Planctomycetaceae bacterium]|nr:Gfo/Idh/MocA family oxidoreductase [Planctomycetaceae bacterium]